MQLISRYQPVGAVQFPQFLARQHYMHEFEADNIIMPAEFEDYKEVVQSLCDGAGFNKGTAFMTVDEKIVQAGQSQRRPGPHVDGHFMKTAMNWGHGGGWNHTCNEVPIARMPVIVAASVAGCKVWSGDFDGEPQNDGDLSHLCLGEGELLPANVGYLLSPDCVHESLVFAQPTQRSFIRLALPPNFKVFQ